MSFWTEIAKAAVAAKKASSISDALQQANQNYADQLNTEGFGFGNLRTVAGGLNQSSNESPSTAGELGDTINQFLGTDQSSTENKKSDSPEAWQKQISKQMMEMMGVKNEPTKDTFNNSFMDAFLRGKNRNLEGAGNFAYLGDMLGDSLRSRIGASATPKLTAEQQMMQAFLGGVMPTDAAISDAGVTAPQGVSQPASITPIGQQAGYVIPPLRGSFEDKMSAAIAGIPPTQYSRTAGSIMGKFVGQPPENILAQDIYKSGTTAKMSADIAREKEQTKTLEEQFGKAARVVRMFSNLVGFGKAMDEDIKVPTLAKNYASAYRGYAGNLGGLPFVTDKFKNETLAPQNYIAQMKEVMIGLTPILSGQARYVAQLAEAIRKTVPDEFRTPKVRAGLISQSIRNTMSMTYGIENGFFTREKAKEFGIDPDKGNMTQAQADALLAAIELTPEQEANIEKAVDIVLNTPAIREGKITKPKEIRTVNDVLKADDATLRELINAK